MHPTDDLTTRGALMVARAAADNRKSVDLRCTDKQPLALATLPSGAPMSDQMKTLLREACRRNALLPRPAPAYRFDENTRPMDANDLRPVNISSIAILAASDAALARAIDAVPAEPINGPRIARYFAETI